MDYCPECGEEVEDDQDYCSNCGNKLTEEGSDSPEEEETTQTSESTEQKSKQEEQEANGKVNSPIKNNIGLIIVAGIAVIGIGLTLLGEPLNEDSITIEEVEWTDPMPNYLNEYENGSPRYYGEVKLTIKASERAPNEFLVRVPTTDDYEGTTDEEKYNNVYFHPGERKEVTVKLERSKTFIMRLKKSLDANSAVTLFPDIRDPRPEELPPALTS